MNESIFEQSKGALAGEGDVTDTADLAKEVELLREQLMQLSVSPEHRASGDADASGDRG